MLDRTTDRIDPGLSSLEYGDFASRGLWVADG
jgi:hypothetical protein